MKIVIEIIAGREHLEPTKEDMQKNIDAIERAINGRMTTLDMVLLMDTKSILEGIKKQLPTG